MKSKKVFAKKDLIIVLGCVVFVLANLGAVGPGGHRRAKEAVCLANLRQWGIIWSIHAEDNDGCFTHEKYWVNPMRPYYKGDKMLLCPAATKPGTIALLWGQWGGPFEAWLGWNDWNVYGSYGLNLWVIDNSTGGRRDSYLWKTPNVKAAPEVPMFLDCTWADLAPWHCDVPPEYEGQPSSGNYDEIRRACINRHSGGINSLFLDFSARKIGLKELWELKWHRGWNKDNNPPPIWPEWMKDFEDYSTY